MRAKDAVITVMDFEGTGTVDGYADEPWQLGLVQLRGGRVDHDSAFSCLLRVGERPFSRYAPGRHAVLRGDIRQADTLQDLWPRLKARFAADALAAHNAATEKRYLRKAFPMQPFGPWIDTLTLTRGAYGALRSHQLEAILDALDLTPKLRRRLPSLAPHDARYDAVGCALLLEKLLALPAWRDIRLDALTHARPRLFESPTSETAAQASRPPT